MHLLEESCKNLRLASLSSQFSTKTSGILLFHHLSVLFTVIVKNSYISKFLDFYFVHYLVGDTIEINTSQPQCMKGTCNRTALEYGFQPWKAMQHSNISNLEYVDQSLVYSRNFSCST